MDEAGPAWIHLTTHPIYQTVTRIKFPDEEGHATGFFYNSEETTYLVTNKHVIDREDGENPDSMRIFTRSEDSFNREYHDLSLSHGEGSDWFSHPLSAAIDVIIIPLDMTLDSVNHRIGIYDERPPETGSLAFNEDSILSEKGRVLAGDRSQIVGYPGHYVDQEFDFPVTRNAIVSSLYGMPYNGEPAFLTDARMHPGTSGSPVVAGPVTLIVHGGIDLWGPGYKLLGVHSATLRQPLVEEEQGKLDLNKAWYAELIEDIIRSVEGTDED